MLAVYNLAGDRLVNWAPDENAVVYPGNDNPNGLYYFAYLRNAWNLTGFVAGVINASADESTSESLLTPKIFEGLTPDQLANLNTPWGRTYLGFASKVGNLWGLS